MHSLYISVVVPGPRLRYIPTVQNTHISRFISIPLRPKSIATYLVLRGEIPETPMYIQGKEAILTIQTYTGRVTSLVL